MTTVNIELTSLTKSWLWVFSYNHRSTVQGVKKRDSLLLTTTLYSWKFRQMAITATNVEQQLKEINGSPKEFGGLETKQNVFILSV